MLFEYMLLRGTDDLDRVNKIFVVEALELDELFLINTLEKIGEYNNDQ